MVSAITKRKRRERQNRTAAAIEEARAEAHAEQRALGTNVTTKVPNAALFLEDRKGGAKAQLEQKFRLDEVAQRAEMRKARRANPPARKSERAAHASEDMKDVNVPGRKMKRDIATVEKHLLETRKFDKPEGHVGNVSALARKAKVHTDGREDVWNSAVSEAVNAEITDSRKQMVRKLTRRMRRAPAIIYPDAGLSVNPSYEHHQDKLGEALAKIVAEEDRQTMVNKKLSFDKSLLEPVEGVEQVTGMQAELVGDQDGEVDDDMGVGEIDAVSNGVPERKTRMQRNKESRKREMQSNITKKKVAARRASDFLKLDAIVEDAQDEADKKNGVTKRMLKSNRVRGPGRKERPIVRRIAKQRVRTESTVDPIFLSKEIGDSLRSVQMPPSNPMLKDRMLSFERRGMVEPPKVLPKEMWRMRQEKRQEERRDKRKRKGKHSKSNVSFWKERSRN